MGTPHTGDELREEREVAAELGITVDELRRRRAADLDAVFAARRAGARWVPAPARPPERIADDTRELGYRNIDRIRDQLAQRQGNRGNP